ncbi:MAG: hypothetical protein U5K33_11165 [Halofilum sp. (in: g-proteobacteria)]|nr:hypothetical protein [Halofilum sp. (in: g-proteobacteria)]
MPKNRLSLRNAQTSGGRSWCSWVIAQSSSMRQSSSTGPSRKACSRSLSAGAGTSSSSFQSGSPRNSSPSHQTVPDSMASRSVSDIGGSTLRMRARSGSESTRRRRSGRFSGTAITRNSAQITSPGQKPSRPVAPSTTSATATAAVQVRKVASMRASATRAPPMTSSQMSNVMCGLRESGRADCAAHQ